MAENKKPQQEESPLIPGSRWRVNDSNRPQPRVVAPGVESTQQAPGRPPSDAIVLFDGKDGSKWVGRDGGAMPWKIENGYMEVVPKTGDIETRDAFGDCQLHLEWAAPAQVEGNSQGRGNSGVFMMGRYEIQILDCYNNPTYADGTTGALYGQCPPLVNACRRPGEWQTYDVIWVGPRFEGERVVRPARATIFLNGVLLHHDKELIGPTTHRRLLPYAPHPAAGPLKLQDHHNPMRFRNIWYRPLTDYDQA
jgi:hypothetical protein